MKDRKKNLFIGIVVVIKKNVVNKMMEIRCLYKDMSVTALQLHHSDISEINNTMEVRCLYKDMSVTALQLHRSDISEVNKMMRDYRE